MSTSPPASARDIEQGACTPIVDGHLDLAYNAMNGRDLALSVVEIRRLEGRTQEQCMVSFPELRRGCVAIVFATLYAEPNRWSEEGEPVYGEPPWEVARRQLHIYRAAQAGGQARVIMSRSELDAHLDLWQHDGLTGIVILMEGADPIERPRDLDEWWQAGVRIVAPAWSRTRYAGGTNRPFGLTESGRELVARMADHGVALDTSHLAEEAFWQALEIGTHAVLASHSNARAIVNTDRQLSDSMVCALGRRGGVVGVNLYNKFLQPSWRRGVEQPFVTLADVRRHAGQMAGLIGWRQVGIGSDLDGCLGSKETPLELDSVADLHLLGDVSPIEHRSDFLGENWLRWLRSTLP